MLFLMDILYKNAAVKHVLQVEKIHAGKWKPIYNELKSVVLKHSKDLFVNNVIYWKQKYKGHLNEKIIFYLWIVFMCVK